MLGSYAAPHRRTQPDLHLLAGMLGELFEGEQRPIHARRGHLQGVLAADRVFDVENTADLPTDGFTVIDEDAFGRSI